MLNKSELSFRLMLTVVTTFVVLLLCTSSGSAFSGNPDNEQQVHDWLTVMLIGDLVLKDEDLGLSFDWTMERRSLLSKQELDQRLAKIQNLVDHPDRSHLEHHKRLHQSPTREAGSALYADPKAWYSVSDMGAGESTTFEAGGTDKLRWMYFQTPQQGNLKIIKEGVPYPAYYDVGQMLRVLQGLLEVHLLRGIPKTKYPMTIEQIRASQSEWTATLIAENNRYSLDLVGEYDPITNQPVILTLNVVHPDKQDHHVMYHFEDYIWSDLIGYAYPEKVQYTRSDNVLEIWHIDSMTIVSRKEVRKAAAVPEPNESDSVLDFTDPDAVNDDLYAETSLLSWQSEDDGDQYDFGGVASTTSHTDPLKTIGQNQTPNTNTTLRTFSIAFSIIVILIFVTIVIMRKYN